MMSPATALSIEKVHKTRPNVGGGSAEILQRLSLSVPAGLLTVIVGPSGGGKTTLVRLINRLEDPDSGRILLAGENTADLDPLVLRRRVGTVMQKPFMYPGTVLANLQQPFLLRGEEPLPAESQEIRSVLDFCRLSPDLLPREARSLSQGEQQRVSLARTVMTGPEVLLLDEPTSALDRPTGDRLAETLRSICRNRQLTILMVTHDLRLAERAADYLAFLDRGRIIEEGAPADLLQRPRTEELRRFLAEPQEMET